MSYLTKEIVKNAIEEMKSLEKTLDKVYSDYGLSFRDNTGRRNAILSQAQEVFLSNALNKNGEISFVDGRTGYPDITVESQGRELECKLTSGSGGTWSLQTDYTTISKKIELDYIYILANRNFDEFAVLFFEGLTKDDFYSPSPGAREKSRMNKSSAMKKCTVFMGDVTVKNEKMSEQYISSVENMIVKASEKINDIDYKISTITAPKKLETLEASRYNLIKRLTKNIVKSVEKANWWSESPLQFTIILEKT